MTATLAPAPRFLTPEPAPASPAPPLRLERRHWLAALAVLVVFFAPYQTLVQTVLTDDAVRKGLNIDDYDMTWQQVGYGVGILYGAFTGLWLSARIGARYTIALGLVGFALGNLVCGTAVGPETFVLGRFVDGFGKMLVMASAEPPSTSSLTACCSWPLACMELAPTRRATRRPLLMAELCVHLSWRWMYWFYIPIALVGMILVWRYFRPDRPPRPIRLPIDWLAVTVFTAWVVAVVFAFSWYRKWGGWSSNAFAVTVILCVALPVVLVIWLGSGYSPDEHLKRLLRSRVVILAFTVRGLMLLTWLRC